MATKKFTAFGLEFECDEKYKYFTMDGDGEFRVFRKMPHPVSLYDNAFWCHSTVGERSEQEQIFPLKPSIPWEESLLEI